MRRFTLAAVTFLQGAVACGSIWGFEDPLPLDVTSGGSPDSGTSEGGAVVETPVAPGDPTRTCVPLPPVDWDGPLIIYEGMGTPLPDAPDCPADYRDAYDGNLQLVAPDAACQCECGPEEGGDCIATLTFFAEKTCAKPCDGTTQQVIPRECTSIPAACGGAKLKTTAKLGSCTPTMRSKKVDPPVWQARGRVCAAPPGRTQAGCPSDRIATPTTRLPFATNTYCIARTGEDACPATYPARRVFYAGMNDSRDCSCACKTPAGGSCDGKVTAADNDSSCKGGERGVSNDDACYETKKPGAKFEAVTTPNHCAPESLAKGSATPTTPTTVCCTR